MGFLGHTYRETGCHQVYQTAFAETFVTKHYTRVHGKTFLFSWGRGKAVVQIDMRMEKLFSSPSDTL